MNKMKTCEICGHDHGGNVVHIKRTVDGSTDRFLDEMMQYVSPDLSRNFLDTYQDHIINLLKI